MSNVNNIVAGHPISIGFLVGDVPNSHAVSAADISATKARGGPVTGNGNARFDIKLSGAIDAQDVAMVKARAGGKLP